MHIDGCASPKPHRAAETCPSPKLHPPQFKPTIGSEGF
jgi:hypothetical protein